MENKKRLVVICAVLSLVVLVGVLAVLYKEVPAQVQVNDPLNDTIMNYVFDGYPGEIKTDAWHIFYKGSGQLHARIYYLEENNTNSIDYMPVGTGTNFLLNPGDNVFNVGFNVSSTSPLGSAYGRFVI